MTQRSWLKLLSKGCEYVSQNKDRYPPKDDKNPPSFLAERIFHRNLHIVKCYIGSARCAGIACLDLLRLNTRSPFNEYNRKTILSLPLVIRH